MRCALASLVLLLACVAGAAEPRQEAKALYGVASKDFAAGRFAEAAEGFESAHRIYPSANLLHNAASAWEKAGQLHFSANALLAFIPLAAGKRRVAAVRWLGKVERRIGATHTRLRLTCSTPGAVLTLDGRPVPATWTGWLTAGDHVIKAAAPGYIASQTSLLADAGSRPEVEVRLLPKPSPPRQTVVAAPRPRVAPEPPEEKTPAPVAPAPVVEHSDALSVAGWTTLSVGASALVVGAVLNVGVGIPAAKQAEKLDPSQPNYAEDHQATVDAANRQYNFPGYALYGIGGALVATSIVLLVVDAQQQTHRITVTPMVDRGGVTLSGRF